MKHKKKRNGAFSSHHSNDVANERERAVTDTSTSTAPIFRSKARTSGSILSQSAAIKRAAAF